MMESSFFTSSQTTIGISKSAFPTDVSLSGHNNDNWPDITSQNSTQLAVVELGLNERLLWQFDIFFNCFFLHFLSLLGIIANILNIMVLSRHTFKETTTVLLLSLSVNDLLCSITQPFRRLQCFFEQFDPLTALTVRSISVVFLFNIPDVFVSISICHTTAIAIERVVAVCFPFHVSRIFTPHRVKWMIAFLYIYSISLMSPICSLQDFVWIYDARYNATRGGYVLSKFYTDHFDDLNRYASAGLSNLFTTSTLATILICSVIICTKLMVGRRKDLVKMATVSNNQARDTRVVKMLLTVCVVTFCVSLPTAVINFYILYSNTPILSRGKVYYLLRSVICCLYQFNTSINFIIYVTLSSKFSQTYRKLIGCRNT